MDKKKKFYELYDLAKINDKDFLKKQELYNLYQKPKKDKGSNMPRIYANEKNAVQQADLLFLPDDNGYKYCLVVVDVGSRLTDAQPIKNKSAEDVKKAFEKIYKRGILKLPSYSIQTDPGSEFKGVVKKYFEDNDVYVRYGKPGRHRQQGLVESRNKIIGTILLKRMQAQELLTNKTSKSWVSHLPTVIKAINNYYPKKYSEMEKSPEIPLCSGDSCEAFEIGTKVRVILDEPHDTQGNKLPGRFRAGDIRFDPKIRTVKQVLVNPGEPIMYLLDGKGIKGGIDSSAAYTKNQLQEIREDEEDAPGEIIFDEETIKNPEMTWVVKKILDKKKVKGKWKLLISWKGFDPKDNTWEDYNEIKKFYPDMVNEFDIKNN